MPELVKIRSDLFPSLYEAFLRDDDPLSDEQDWRNVFDYQWERDEDYSGYALLEGREVIGMMAMAFSQRIIEGRVHKFCNLHTWWVHEDHRGHSFMMLRPLLKLRDYTVTHFTPCDRVRALTKRLGFIDLDLQMKVLLPLWPLGKGQPGGNAELVFGDAIDTSRMSPQDRRIFQDHQPYRVGSLLVGEGDGACFILYTTVERYRVRYCHIHHVGNQESFARAEETVRSALMRKHGVRLVVLDKRLVEGMSFRRSFDFWTPAHAVFRPAEGMPAERIDNLYSDVVMLRLAILPHVSHELKKIARQWLPGKKDTDAFRADAVAR